MDSSQLDDLASHCADSRYDGKVHYDQFVGQLVNGLVAQPRVAWEAVTRQQDRPVWRASPRGAPGARPGSAGSTASLAGSMRRGAAPGGGGHRPAPTHRPSPRKVGMTSPRDPRQQWHEDLMSPRAHRLMQMDGPASRQPMHVALGRG